MAKLKSIVFGSVKHFLGGFNFCNFDPCYSTSKASLFFNSIVKKNTIDSSFFQLRSKSSDYSI